MMKIFAFKKLLSQEKQLGSDGNDELIVRANRFNCMNINEDTFFNKPSELLQLVQIEAPDLM